MRRSNIVLGVIGMILCWAFPIYVSGQIGYQRGYHAGSVVTTCILKGGWSIK